MGEHGYSDQSHVLPQTSNLSGSLNMSSGARAPIAPVSTYPDLNSYSTGSPFNIQNQCDANLLTPISTSASPPLHQGPKFNRQQYPPSTPQQALTPPGSSRMYQWPDQLNHFEMAGQASHSGSPIPHPSNTTHEYVEPPPPMAEARRSPNPPELYMGAYAVSDASGYHGMPQHQGPYYMHQVQQDPVMIRDDASMPMEVVDRQNQSTAPMLSQPPAGYRTRRDADDSPPSYHRAGEQRSGSSSPRRRIAQGNPRIRKRITNRKSVSRNVPRVVDPMEEHKNCHGEEVPPRLSDKCPQEERFIFDARWKYRDQKGQDMWNSIQRDYERIFQKTHGKEMLQMKFKRGRAKYIEWLPKDISLLNEAFEAVEAERYQNILDKFLELGGSRNMRLNASDIEIKLVTDLKVEEGMYMERFGNLGVRRRRKAGARKRSNVRGQDDVETVHEDMTSVNSRNAHEDEVINQVFTQRGSLESDSLAPVGSEMESRMLKKESSHSSHPTDRYNDYNRQPPNLIYAVGVYDRHRV